MQPATDQKHVVRIGNRIVELTNLDRLLWPADGITKADLIAYYIGIAPRLLPHLKNRPLTLTRYPQGIEGHMFYQKNTPDYAPDWLLTYEAQSSDTDKKIRYLLAEEPAALAWLANQGTIEVHPWMAPIDHPAHPDYAVVDLDPSPGASFKDVVTIAHLVRTLLQQWDLQGFPKLSGATGIHIYVPVIPHYTYRQTGEFVGYIGRLIEKAYPEKATTQRSVSRRGARVYVDHLQNRPGKTIVAPYVPRSLPGAPISLPVDWDELDDVTPGEWTIRALNRILARPAAFDTMYQVRQSLDHVLSPTEGKHQRT
ncbi:MAG: non-homologous end-joining DNA ligase [Limnochordia bacterium]|jgi:bifunctional non-homologous end joining protein LigD